MSISTILGLIILGVFAGSLSSLVGIGGGIVIVPALVGIFGLSQHTAQGTTLAMLSFPISLVAAFTYYKNGMVDWKIAMVLCIGFVIGSFFVSKIAVSIPT
ncbi:MAG: TSUP family transporter, partial [Chitinophagaceae bacterium]